MTIDEMIDVLQAAKTGKQIQELMHEGGSQWMDQDMKWWLRHKEFRVKPEPREWMLCNGYDKNWWIVVNEDHCHTNCPGEKVKVREVSE